MTYVESGVDIEKEEHAINELLTQIKTKRKGIGKPLGGHYAGLIEFKDYALVAGGHNFREDKSSRIKNRFFHKQRGFVAEYGRPACVGCGRCIEACPAGINIIELITKLRSESYV